MTEVDINDLWAIIQQQRDEIDDLKAKVNRWEFNGAEDMFGGAGFQRYAGGVMRLDKNGIQMQSDAAEQRSIYWVDSFQSDLGDPPDAIVEFSGFSNAQILAAYGKWNAFYDGADGTTVEISSGTDSSFKVQVVDNAGANSPTDPAEIIAEHSQIDGESFIRLKADNIVDKNGNKVGGMALIVKTADESVSSSTTLQDDDDLTFAVGSNEQWQFEGVILWEETSSGADPKFTFVGPSGAVGGFLLDNASDTSEDFSGGELGDVIAYPLVSGVVRGMRFWGSIATSSTAGNLTLQWAQNQSSTDATIIHAGSYLKYQQAS